MNNTALSLLHGIYEKLDSPTEFYLEVAKGNIAGTKHIQQVGKMASVGTQYETVWDMGGDYPYLTTPIKLKGSSDNSNDTASGIGARTIEIFGLDENYNEVSEIISSDGQNEVTTKNNYIRLSYGVVRSAGDEEGLVGNFYIGTGDLIDGVPNTILMKILPENNKTRMGIYTIPAGKIGFLVGKTMSSNRDKETLFQIRIRPENEVFQVNQNDMIYQSYKYISYPIPLSTEEGGIKEKSDIEIRAKIDAGTAKVIGGYDLILIDA